MERLRQLYDERDMRLAASSRAVPVKAEAKHSEADPNSAGPTAVPSEANTTTNNETPPTAAAAAASHMHGNVRRVLARTPMPADVMRAAEKQADGGDTEQLPQSLRLFLFERSCAGTITAQRKTREEEREELANKHTLEMDALWAEMHEREEAVMAGDGAAAEASTAMIARLVDGHVEERRRLEERWEVRHSGASELINKCLF